MSHYRKHSNRSKRQKNPGMKRIYATQYDKMTEMPVGRLILMLGIPSTICILITHVYNIVDTYYVGKLGTSASGAVGIVFGIMAVLQAFGFMYGQGAGIIDSKLLGAKQKDRANEVASVALFSAFVTGIILSMAGYCFLDRIICFLGSTDTIYPFAEEYAVWIFLAAPFTLCSLTLNNLLRYQGKAYMGTVGIGAGTVLNIVLDPILMFRCGLGIDGAGIATAVSQCVSFTVLFVLFQSRRCQQNFHLREVCCFWREIREICAAGLPAFVGQILGVMSTMLLNREAMIYGDAAIAAMSIVGRISFFMFAVALGIAQGFQPVAGFSFGAQKYSRVRKGFLFTLTVCELLLGCFAAVGMLLSGDVIGVFRDDAEVVAIGSAALFIQCIGVLFLPLLSCTNVFLQSVGKNREASLVSAMRSGLFFMPLILILPRFWGLKGIEAAQPVADMLGFLVTLPMAIGLYRQLCKEESDLI